MNALRTYIYSVSLFCAALPATAADPSESASMVYAPAGDLGDAVESLARQTGHNILYPGDLLVGRRTAGVDGIRTPQDAFAKLLEGTSLVAIEVRGGLRITRAPTPEPLPMVVTAAPIAAQTHSKESAPAIWKRRELRLACRGCDFTNELKQILQRLGATEVSADTRSATFSSLTLAGGARGTVAAQSQLTMHWETIAFGPVGSQSSSEVIQVAPILFENLRGRVLPHFTTRGLREENGRITVDALVPGEGPGAAECHKVIQSGSVQRYCGSAEQWRDLQIRVGFSCRVEGKGNELCASATEWRRVNLLEATRRSLLFAHGITDEATASAEQNHPFIAEQPSVSAPVTPPPAPAPSN